MEKSFYIPALLLICFFCLFHRLWWRRPNEGNWRRRNLIVLICVSIALGTGIFSLVGVSIRAWSRLYEGILHPHHHYQNTGRSLSVGSHQEWKQKKLAALGMNWHWARAELMARALFTPDQNYVCHSSLPEVCDLADQVSRNRPPIRLRTGILHWVLISGFITLSIAFISTGYNQTRIDKLAMKHNDIIPLGP